MDQLLGSLVFFCFIGGLTVAHHWWTMRNGDKLDASCRSSYHTVMMYLIKVFSVLMLFCSALFTALYCISFISDKVGYCPWWSISILAIMAAVAVIMWKVA